MTSTAGLRNLVLSIVLALTLLIAVPVTLLAGASLASFFEIGVRSEQSAMARGLARGELVRALLVGEVMVGVAVVWLRRLWRMGDSGRRNASEGRRAQ